MHIDNMLNNALKFNGQGKSAKLLGKYLGNLHLTVGFETSIACMTFVREAANEIRVVNFFNPSESKQIIFVVTSNEVTFRGSGCK
jgi:hypothetical protein